MDGRLVLLLVSVCVTLVSAASSIPKCDDAKIAKFKTYWKKNGIPKNIIQSKDTFHVVTGTPSPVADYAKCKHVSFSAPSGTTKTYTYNFQEENGHFPVTESNGILSVDGGMQKFSLYILSMDKAMMITYKCSGDGPANATPDVTIGVTTFTKKDDLAAMTTTLQGMGFNVASFGCK